MHLYVRYNIQKLLDLPHYDNSGQNVFKGIAQNYTDGRYNGTVALLWSKMAKFKRAWHKVIVLPRPWAAGSTQPLIRPLKWGTLRVWTPSGSGMTSRQSWKYEKKSVLVRKMNFFSNFQLWRLVIPEPLGVQTHNVPHFKGQISG